MAAAVVVRTACALYLGDSIQTLPGIADQVSYDTLAQRVLAGYGFTFPVDWWPATRAGAPTAHWSFLYTLYLAGVYAVAGWHPLAARLVQAVAAGLLYPVLTWRIGRQMFGPAVGLAAALLTTVYGYFVYYAGALMTETWYILAILWAFDLAMRIAVQRWSIRTRQWLQLGLALAIAVLLRQLILLFVPVLFAWLIWAKAPRPWGGLRQARSRLRPVLLGLASSTAVIVLMIAPWTVRNYLAFGRPVLLNTNAGYAFFWANHPLQGAEFVPIFPSKVYYDMIPRELLRLDEAALESALLQRGVQFVLDDPGRYARLSLSRVKDYFEFWPTPDSSPVSNLARVFSFGLYLPLMLYGVGVTIVRRSSIRPGRGRSVILIYLFGLVYTTIHLLSWTLVRYRLPLDAVLMPVAGLSIVDLVGTARTSTFVSRVRGGVGHHAGLAAAARRRVLRDPEAP